MEKKKEMAKSMKIVWFVLSLVLLFTTFERTAGDNVTYDGRSLIIDGQHKLLFSGSIHYPRSTPDMWPSLIAGAKEGGLDVIQTYVFWNLHEPMKGHYNFSGSNDLVRFIKEVQAQGLYVALRIGPFIEAEWNHGGLPVWLRDVPGITFRTDNEPFKHYMKKFTTKIVHMMKSEKLYASQGGPIILSQIENEYTLVERAFHDDGPRYVHWAANMSVSLNTGVPWIMCRQDDAPDPLINTCNGMRCGQTFAGPNSPNKPSMWTENWTSFVQGYGEETHFRSAEDIAFHVALFTAMNGSYVNYYMYHGGTNLGRTASSYVVTSYYDQAPLDEYGLRRQPKWGHLRELHAAIKLCSKTLLFGNRTTTSLSHGYQEVHEFQTNSGECAAFLVNFGNRDARIHYQNSTYDLPRKSISILPDCKNVVFNTAKVSTQYGERFVISSQKFDSEEKWQEYREVIPEFDKTITRANNIQEQISMTGDKYDYLWYTLRIHHDSPNTQVKLDVSTMGHVLHAFVNGDHIGSAHGSRGTKSFSLQSPISLRSGTNYISLLSGMVGLADGGAHLERRFAGLRRVRIEGKDFTRHYWGYQVGLLGEQSQIYTDPRTSEVQWSKFRSSNQPLTWYMLSFDAPEGDDPVAINLGTMSKGEVWVNGQSIGRYWVTLLTSKGNPSQTWYHIPRSFLKPTGNLLVLFEEQTGNPLGISVDTLSYNKICGLVSESHYPPVASWERHNGSLAVELNCPPKKKITDILFASFGNPTGDCESYAIGNCHSPNSTAIVEKECLGKTGCSISLSNPMFSDPCPGIPKALLVDAQCT